MVLPCTVVPPVPASWAERKPAWPATAVEVVMRPLEIPPPATVMAPAEASEVPPRLRLPPKAPIGPVKAEAPVRVRVLAPTLEMPTAPERVPA